MRISCTGAFDSLAGFTSRRWFYFVPAQGEPVKLSHRVEPRKLDPLPGRQEFFLAWPFAVGMILLDELRRWLIRRNVRWVVDLTGS